MTLLSPGIQIREKDFTGIVPNVSTSIGAIAGHFSKGPIETPTLVSSEEELVSYFGQPTEQNYGAWLAAGEFLKYANKLYVSRCATSGTLNATVGTAVLVKNYKHFEELQGAGSLSAAGLFIAKNPGTSGNSLKVYLVDNNNFDAMVADTTLVDEKGTALYKYVAIKPTTTKYVLDRSKGIAKFDELSVIVVDATGEISGKANTVLEYWNNLSKAEDGVDFKGGTSNFAKVINQTSKYVYINGVPTSNIESVISNVKAWDVSVYEILGQTDAQEDRFAKLNASVVSYELNDGYLSDVVTDDAILDAYLVFENPEDSPPISLIITANYNPANVVKQVIEMAATRKDCVVFVSPTDTTTSYNGGAFVNKSTMLDSIKAYRALLNVADEYLSYAFMDSGYKYMYDKYNRVYRWVALNGDTAGIVAKTDMVADAWWSPGGYNRGGYKNVIKLNWSPSQAQRDILYSEYQVNPVVSFQGSGTILFGDRTMQVKPSAFDRINVRRLFIILEKAISIAAKYQLFEFNDTFTRAQFKNMVEPFLRDIQGRRGITDFKVICDTSNNTGEVIDRNEFIADIYIKPARSINYIYLNFIATRTGVDFSTVIGG